MIPVWAQLDKDLLQNATSDPPVENDNKLQVSESASIKLHKPTQTKNPKQGSLLGAWKTMLHNNY